MSKENKLTTSKEIAADLGVHRLTISRIARDNKIGSHVGNIRVFSPAEVRRIKKLCMFSKGNPNFKRNRDKV